MPPETRAEKAQTDEYSSIWFWLSPLALSLFGYIVFIAIFNARDHIQCIGYKVVAASVVLSILAGILTTVLNITIRPKHTIAKIFACVFGGVLSIPLLVPAGLSLVGIHAGDNVCRSARLSEEPHKVTPIDMMPSAPVSLAQPRAPIIHDAIPRFKCSQGQPIGYSYSVGECEQ